MARSEEWREHLELLNASFPDCGVLTVDEVMQFMNIKSKKTVLKHLGTYFKANRISKVYVAKFMCSERKN